MPGCSCCVEGCLPKANKVLLAAALVTAGLVSGCFPAAESERVLPAGVVAIWGHRGRIDGMFVKPRVIDVLSGDVIVIDRSGRVQRFDPLGVFKDKFALSDVVKGYPTGMTIGPDGNIWIAETHAYRVAVYSPEYDQLFAFGGYGDGDGQFVYVTDVAVSREGRVYVSEFGGTNRVQEFKIDGTFVRLVGGDGVEPGMFRRPQALACSDDGSLYVADSVNHRIQKFAADGTLEGVFGAAGDGEGRLTYPYDLAIGPDQTVYICEYGNHRIQRMSPEGEFLGSWSGGGDLRLVGPWGVAVDGNRMFVLDTGNSRVLHLEIDKLEWSIAREA